MCPGSIKPTRWSTGKQPLHLFLSSSVPRNSAVLCHSAAHILRYVTTHGIAVDQTSSAGPRSASPSGTRPAREYSTFTPGPAVLATRLRLILAGAEVIALRCGSAGVDVQRGCERGTTQSVINEYLVDLALSADEGQIILHKCQQGSFAVE